jgi:hypothetical protein
MGTSWISALLFPVVLRAFIVDEVDGLEYEFCQVRYETEYW